MFDFSNIYRIAARILAEDYKKDYHKIDHVHCFNDQKGHEEHLGCCLCLEVNKKIRRKKMPPNIYIQFDQKSRKGFTRRFFFWDGKEELSATLTEKEYDVMRVIFGKLKSTRQDK